jgi:hypothetical protein
MLFHDARLPTAGSTVSSQVVRSSLAYCTFSWLSSYRLQRHAAHARWANTCEHMISTHQSSSTTSLYHYHCAAGFTPTDRDRPPLLPASSNPSTAAPPVAVWDAEASAQAQMTSSASSQPSKTRAVDVMALLLPGETALALYLCPNNTSAVSSPTCQKWVPQPSNCYQRHGFLLSHGQFGITAAVKARICH